MTEISDHLRGPWKAQALTAADTETDLVQHVFVLRVARGDGLSQPAGYPMVVLHDDVLYEIREFGDEAEVQVRWEQARAVADALNALSGRSSNEPGA